LRYRGDASKECGGRQVTVANPLYCSLPWGNRLDRKRYVALAVALLILIAITRILLTYKVTAQGFDEPCHVAAAIEYLDQGTYTLDPVHPPLSRIAIGIPLYLAGKRFPHWPTSDPRIRNYNDVGNSLLYDDGHYLRNLSLARSAILPFFGLAVVLVFLWTRREFGDFAGVMAAPVYNAPHRARVFRPGLYRFAHGLHAVCGVIRICNLAAEAIPAVDPVAGESWPLSPFSRN
jgi:hypothetical protein